MGKTTEGIPCGSSVYGEVCVRVAMVDTANEWLARSTTTTTRGTDDGGREGRKRGWKREKG